MNFENIDDLNMAFDTLKLDHEWSDMQKLLHNNARLCIENNWDLKALHKKLKELIDLDLMRENLINKL